MNRKGIFLTGPALLLAAQVILPLGSAEVTTRIEIIKSNNSSWLWGHIIILVAFVAMALCFVRIYSIAKLLSPLVSLIGLILLLIALMSDTGIAIINLISQNVVNTQSSGTAAVIQSFTSQGIQLFLFAPYFLFLPGSVLLVFPLKKVNGYKIATLLFMLFGLLIVAGGILQNKILLILASCFLLYASWQMSGQTNSNQ